MHGFFSEKNKSGKTRVGLLAPSWEFGRGGSETLKEAIRDYKEGRVWRHVSQLLRKTNARSPEEQTPKLERRIPATVWDQSEDSIKHLWTQAADFRKKKIMWCHRVRSSIPSLISVPNTNKCLFRSEAQDLEEAEEEKARFWRQSLSPSYESQHSSHVPSETSPMAPINQAYQFKGIFSIAENDVDISKQCSVLRGLACLQIKQADEASDMFFLDMRRPLAIQSIQFNNWISPVPKSINAAGSSMWGTKQGPQFFTVRYHPAGLIQIKLQKGWIRLASSREGNNAATHPPHLACASRAAALAIVRCAHSGDMAWNNLIWERAPLQRWAHTSLPGAEEVPTTDIGSSQAWGYHSLIRVLYLLSSAIGEPSWRNQKNPAEAKTASSIKGIRRPHGLVMLNEDKRNSSQGSIVGTKRLSVSQKAVFSIKENSTAEKNGEKCLLQYSTRSLSSFKDEKGSADGSASFLRRWQMKSKFGGVHWPPLSGERWSFSFLEFSALRSVS
ncbi:hypothetical protein H6P81_000533 [Aristolochia fimbriata]|uniref:Uncharacterized protein n=1 Tax=Aristolochia fimbriata TaxID=158543 RepID=A0AAV7F6Y3_ARIFI|nr:hypothetical protein H6P81_000533 [Aristolochia fimbriata]